jgi:hypothetical protein
MLRLNYQNVSQHCLIPFTDILHIRRMFEHETKLLFLMGLKCNFCFHLTQFSSLLITKIAVY